MLIQVSSRKEKAEIQVREPELEPGSKLDLIQSLRSSLAHSLA